MENTIKAFTSIAKSIYNKTYAQNLQDLWGLWENSSKNNSKYFVEFGALGGIHVSNSYLMEKLDWNGIVAEPHPNYRNHLEKNRNCHKCYDAVYSETGKELIFKIFKGMPARSTLKEFERIDDDGTNPNTVEFKEVTVNTISLTSLLAKFNAPQRISFISIDTEGSEYAILQNFDFSKYVFNSICVEYGTQKNRELIYSLLKSHGYTRKWEIFSGHDDWYVHDSNIPIDAEIFNDYMEIIKKQPIVDMDRRNNRLQRKLNKTFS